MKGNVFPETIFVAVETDDEDAANISAYADAALAAHYEGDVVVGVYRLDHTAKLKTTVDVEETD